MFSKIFRTFIGILLIPLAVSAGRAFCLSMSSIDLSDGVLYNLERGVLVYLVFHIFVMKPVYIYVIGHEFVHVIATWICGGKIESFKVSSEGGNVVTSKTNFFIELSPYFVPVYVVLAAGIYLILELSGKTNQAWSNIFIFSVGFTLAFHFVMTYEVLKMQQPDILKSGLIFSFVTIFIFNIVIVMAVLAPIFSEVKFFDFIRELYDNSIDIYRNAYLSIVQLIEDIRVYK